MRMFTAPRSVQQVAALPFVVTARSVELLLVTSRRRRRWIVPKGWPEKGMTLAEAAEREAWEEAGVRGRLATAPIGRYGYAKRMRAGYEVPAAVLVYPLLVGAQFLDWPERRKRSTAWHPLSKAPSILDDPDLARLLRRLASRDGEKLRFLAGKLNESDLVMAE